MKAKKLLCVLLATVLVLGTVCTSVFAAEMPFKDVGELTEEFKGALEYVYSKGIMNGIEEDVFDPFGFLTRGMLVTILHRSADEPIVNYAMTFKDVPNGEYYTEAVRWAQATGIVNGVTETEFEPDTFINREQLAAIMYRYANSSKLDIDTPGKDTNTLSYNDITEVSEYARPAVHACLAADILVSRDGKNIEPLENATRIEAAYAIMGVNKLEKVIENIDITALGGEYFDTVSQRAVMTVAVEDENIAKATVNWASSAAESSEWTMTLRAQDGMLTYNDGVEKIVTFDEDLVKHEEIVNENVEGYFTYSDGLLYWDGADNEDCRACIFKKSESPSIGMPNPLVEKTEKEIEKEFGFKFGKLKNEKNVKFYVIDGEMIEKIFELGDTKITLRVVPAIEFEDISGMYYAWTEEDGKVKNRDAKIMSAKDDLGSAQVCLWYDAAPGLMYSASATAKDLDGFDITAIAEQTFIPVQGDK